MKKVTTICAFVLVLLLAGSSTLYAQQTYSFEGDTVGQPYGTTSWSDGDISATVDSVVIDTVTYGNVLKVEVNNYNAAPYFAFTIPGGLTLADFDTLSFQGYFATGDVGYKDIKAVVSTDSLSGPFGSDDGENDVLGSVNRAQGASTGWEEIRIGIDNTRDLSGTIYIGFGISATDSANGEATVWYADDIMIEVKPAELDSGPITKWARTSSYNSWPIQKDGSTPAGSASLGDETTIPDGQWGSIRGSFAPVTAGSGEGNAFVLTGKMEINASLGSGYTPIRYALTNFDDVGAIENENTETARWFSASSSSGYSFMPVSGAGTMANGGGGAGTVWTINSGNWISTWSNNGGPISSDTQVPQLGEIVAGTYDVAFSVEAIDDTTNEIRWYLIHENEEYWWGGTTVAQATSDAFNSVIFGFLGAEGFTEVNFSEFEATNGDPIEVPTPPFEDHYLSMWGATTNGSGVWPILNDSTTFDGNASMGSEEGANQSGWKTIRGAFDYDVETTSETDAVIVTGQLELVGSGLGNGYSPLRYALTYQNDLTLNNQYTDSAIFSASQSWGYEFTPLSGTGVLPNGAGGGGTVWSIINGNWNSTYSNGGGPLGIIYQIPTSAEMVAGVYDWAISVHPVADDMNEIRWYMIHEDDDYYFAGSLQDTATTTVFNAINFGIGENNEDAAGLTEVKVIDAKVDKGEPIEIPQPAFYNHFVSIDGFGFLGGKYGGDWTLTPGDFTGNTSVSGSAATDWAAVRAGFQVPSTPGTGADEALVIEEGTVSFTDGGFEEDDSFLFGVFEAANPGTVDSTEERGYEWNGSEDGHTGYLFNPAAGTITAISDGVWHNAAGGTEVGSVTSSGTPTAGDYTFTVSVQPGSEGMEINVSLTGDDNDFSFEASVVDENSTATTFNGLNFAVNNSTTTGMAIEDVQIKEAAAIVVSNEKDGLSDLPKVFALNQNYPNPFNPTTNISFDLPQVADVQLEVYNMLGQKVMTLVNRRMEGGSHQVTFDARNLASGMYVYRIEAGSFISTKKMMLIK